MFNSGIDRESPDGVTVRWWTPSIEAMRENQDRINITQTLALEQSRESSYQSFRDALSSNVAEYNGNFTAEDLERWQARLFAPENEGTRRFLQGEWGEFEKPIEACPYFLKDFHRL